MMVEVMIVAQQPAMAYDKVSLSTAGKKGEIGVRPEFSIRVCKTRLGLAKRTAFLGLIPRRSSRRCPWATDCALP